MSAMPSVPSGVGRCKPYLYWSSPCLCCHRWFWQQKPSNWDRSNPSSTDRRDGRKRFPLKNRLSILGRNPTLLQTLQSVTREVISLIDGLVRDFTDALTST